jgi:tetratricopeptide (TPR) repeat protein
LFCKKGKILFNMGRYNESVEAFDKALSIKAHHSYFYNKAVALQRLGQEANTIKALQQAIDCANNTEEHEIAKDYDGYLKRIRDREKPLIWWEWWFSQGGLGRKIFGSILLFSFVVEITPIVVITLWNVIGGFIHIGFVPHWSVLGNNWVWFGIPVISSLLIILSPVMRSLGTQGVELQLINREEKPLEINKDSLGPLVQRIDNEEKGELFKDNDNKAIML